MLPLGRIPGLDIRELVVIILLVLGGRAAGLFGVGAQLYATKLPKQVAVCKILV